MRPARASTAALVALVVAALTWTLFDVLTRQGGRLPPLPWFAVVALLVVAAVVAVLGWEVRRSVRGERRPPLDPLMSARVVVLAKAAVLGGAALAGWYAGQALVLLDDPGGTRRERLLVAVATTVAAVVVSGAGLLAQRWCRLPDDDGTGADADADLLTPPQQRAADD